MPVCPLFHGRVSEQGTLVLSHDETEARHAHLRSLAGQFIEIVIRKQRTQRTLDQNALIHAVVSALADHCGNSIGEMKLILMGECWGWKTVQGHEIPVKPHTSDMTVEEASYFIDWLFPWMAEHFPEVRINREMVA